MNPIILRRFNLDYIYKNSLIVIIGMNNSGKSFVTKDILYNFKYIECGTVISEVRMKQNCYNYIPPIFIHDKYDNTILKNFIRRQKKLINTDYDSHSFIILENLFNNDKYFQKIIKSPKLLNYLCIIESINLIYIDTKTIENIDYLFILKENFDINRKRIYEQFSKYLNIPYTLFCKFMNDYTENYNFLILDLKSGSKQIEDKLFWYKADDHKNFKVCSKESWEYNDKNYIKELPLKNIDRNIFW
jgi:hypothetical protein